MEAFANESGLISEQIWDEREVPGRELFFGRPSGSATPLVWAHAEYIKLHRSLDDRRVFDMPPQPVHRYLREHAAAAFSIWRYNNKSRTGANSTQLRLELLAPAVVHWSSDGWKTVHDTSTQDVGLGIYVADLPTTRLSAGAEVTFTFYWPQPRQWEGETSR